MKRVLVAGWFSFSDGHATAGDLLSRDLLVEWLKELNCSVLVAVAPPFTDGIDWRKVSPSSVDEVVFVCGPFHNGLLEQTFLKHFQDVPAIGVNLTMLQPLKDFNPFFGLLERDSTRTARPDLVFATRQPLVPVVGVCLVEPYPQGLTDEANAYIDRLISSRQLAVVRIDTRLDYNETGLRTPGEIESIIARVDVLITTRLHGAVLALKNHVPVIAIDPERGGFKIKRQADLIGWPRVFVVDKLTDLALSEALEFCLTPGARLLARGCAERAINQIHETKRAFVKLVASASTQHRAP